MKKSLYFLIGFILTYTPLSAEENGLIALDFDGTNYTVSSVNSTTGAKTALKSFTSPYGTCAGCSFVDEYGGKFYIGGGTGFAVYDISDNSVSYLPKDGGTLLYRQMAWSGDDVISASSDDAEIKIDETNNTVNIDNAAIADGDGNNIIALKDDGAVHIGENSLITVEQDGVQKLYAEDENGDAIDIDITNGSDLLINGVSVIDRLNASNRTYIDSIANNLADGIEDSNAMSAALAALPNTAPDAEAYCGGGIGSYGDAQAFSLGCASNINDNFAVNFGASKLSSSGASIGNRDFDDYSLKAGFIYKIGYKPSKSSKSNTATLEAELYRQQASLRAIAEKENYKDTKIADYEKRLAKLEDQKTIEAAEYESRLAKLEEQKAIEAAEYEHKFTMLEDQLEELKVAMLAGNKEFASLAK